jgi:hypothetical protein
MSNKNYKTNGEYIEIKIYKPLYGTFCYIRDTYIWEAQRTGKKLRITVPQGVGIMTAEEWLNGAKRMEKVFKIPTKPMILYGNEVKI